MKASNRLVLTRAAMAIAQRDGRNVAIMVPKGAIIEVIGGPFNGSRLMDVNYDDDIVMMFTNDLENHTESTKRRSALALTKSSMCENIDDETVERIAMGHAVDPLIKDHVAHCIHCHARLLDYQEWVKWVKIGLRSTEGPDSR